MSNRIPASEAHTMAVKLYETLQVISPKDIVLYRPGVGSHVFLAKLPGPRNISVSVSIAPDSMNHPVDGFYAEFLLKDRHGRIFYADNLGYGDVKQFFSLQKMVSEFVKLANLASIDKIEPNNGWADICIDPESGLALDVLKKMLNSFRCLENTSKLTQGVVTQDHKGRETISKLDQKYNHLADNIEVIVDMYFGFPEGQQKFEAVVGFKNEQLKFLIETMSKVLQERIDAVEKS